MSRCHRRTAALIALGTLLTALPASAADSVPFQTRSAKTGNWSDSATWENGRAPQAGDSVQVRPGHSVTYDVTSDAGLRMIHVGGTLTFSREKSTKLKVGLIKVQRGEQEVTEDGFACAAHALVEQVDDSKGPLPVLEIGTADRPIPAGVTTVIQLAAVAGQNAETCPAIINCGGRWDVHGAPMSRTWVKLAVQANNGSSTVELAERVTGWNAGDRIILTETRMLDEVKADEPSGSEERTIVSISGTTLKLDKPLAQVHHAADSGRGEVANLSRNVVIESADPDGVRGHTMYHRHSTGGISYAEFRHLGKKGLLGKYPIHFHLVRDSMRGSGVIGASIWDSQNRFIAIHGTDYLLVRDCVGFKTIGHGYFLEDATEQYNILDRNLAVQCDKGKRLPQQVLDFDANDGAGFWWANGRNTLTRNVAAENHKYGFRFEIARARGDDPVVGLRQPDGSVKDTDVRTVPFFRFEDNESHSEGLYSFFFGDDPNRSVHGDKQHPFIARNLHAWSTHYALRPSVQYFLMENLRIDNAVYGVYHPEYDAQVFRNIVLNRVISEPINRAHDDESVQTGSFTYDGLTLNNCNGGELIQLSCTSPTDGNEGHFRNLTVTGRRSRDCPVVDLGSGPRLKPDKLERPVAYFFHDSTYDGQATKLMSTRFPQVMNDPAYAPVDGLTGEEVRGARVEGVAFPKLLDPVDDLPPATVITSVRKDGDKLIVHGVTHDNGDVARIDVNGQAATVTVSGAGISDWEAQLAAGSAPTVSAAATDNAGNVERPVVATPLR
jgi:hypothetical protein